MCHYTIYVHGILELPDRLSISAFSGLMMSVRIR